LLIKRFVFINSIPEIQIGNYPTNKNRICQRYGISKTDDELLTFLNTRLAKGEITKEEFDKIKESLND